MDAIFQRRSIRKYTDAAIGCDTIEKCLKAAVMAPSAGNEQAWEFIVTKGENRLAELASVIPNGAPLSGAAAAITVCGNRSMLKYPQDYWVEDCTMAAYNIMLQATELGLGTVWLAIYPCDDRIAAVSQYMNLPDQVIPLCIISMGYPAEEKETPERDYKRKTHILHW